MPNASVPSRRLRAQLTTAAALLTAAAMSSGPALADDRAAHALAAKFAAAADGKPAHDLKAEEKEMLERAEAEALERKAAAEKEAADKEAAERDAEKAEQARIAAEAEAQKAKAKAEQERLAREEVERKAKEDQRIAEDKHKAEEQARITAEVEAQNAKAKAEQERLAREEIERKAKEDQRIAEDKRKADEKPPVSAETQKVDTSGAVTVLLIMEPGTTGIRRYGSKTADPVICAETRCWISTGAGSAARMVSRGQALGPGNTLGKRAEACNHSLGCVFRNVDLSTIGMMQPIDLRVMHHDRREPQRILADSTCEAGPSALTCGKLLRSSTWRAWIVPEAIASKAGDKALLRALEAGLSPGREAALR